MNTAPKHVEWSGTRIDGEPGHRLMIIFAAPGCAWARDYGGCTNCSFAQTFGVGVPVSQAEYEAQLHAALQRRPPHALGPLAIDLYVSGSFCNPDEVPEPAQESLVRLAAGVVGVRRLVIETRPEYVTAARLERVARAAGGVPLEVAVGLESADRIIRERRVHKGFTWPQFAAAVQLIAAHRLELGVHILLKPLDTTEREAVDDAVRSAEQVFTLAAEQRVATRVSLQPCFVAPQSALEQRFLAGEYTPPWLWSVVEVVRRLAGRGRLTVGLSDEGMGPQRRAFNCDTCSAGVLAALAAFNASGEVAPLTALDCACRAEWRAALAERGE